MPNEEGQRRKGPSNLTISIGGVIGLLGLFITISANYTTLREDIVGLKRGEVYQEQTNQQLRDAIKAVHAEQREALKEFNEKSDKILGIVSAMERDHKK